MKRTLSLILALLMLASSMTACGSGETKETEKPVDTSVTETNAPATEKSETDSPDTNPPATEPPETEAPAPAYDTTMITENGVAKAHIVLIEGASDREKTAADELVKHIKLVSGADITVTNTAAEDSLPIIIATPDSLPELETLFPEDLAWLRTTKETNENGETRRWGDDGFAVRQKDGKIYILGATSEGALNGVYDFIEENMDVIWITSFDAGIIYDEMPTIHVVQADYREKSPFLIRNRGGAEPLVTRNKHLTGSYTAEYPVGAEHNVKFLLTTSPTYDPNITEYWDTDIEGKHLSAADSKQVNYWSELTAVTVAESVIAKLDAYDDASRPRYFSVGMEDMYDPSVYPEMTVPFEYAPGQFVDTTNVAYLSTVYYTFINRVAAKVAEKYPDTKILTLSYQYSIEPPLCEMDDNVAIWFCPYYEDFTHESFEVTLAEAEAGDKTSLSTLEAVYYQNWLEQHPNTEILIYNYYFIYCVAGWYERPLWYRIQKDLQMYAEDGVIGTTSCTNIYDTDNSICTFANYGDDSFPYKFTNADTHAMNIMSLWIFYKLCWNPYEDVDALIVEFCDKVYGDASDEMQEYYRLIDYGWKYCSTEIIPYEFNAKLGLSRDQGYYFMYFLDFELEDGTYFLDAVTAAITKAWEAADDKAKEFIRRPYEVFSEGWERFLG